MSKKKEFKRMAEDARLEAGKLMTSKQIASCHTIIHTSAITCGGLGFIPIPIADAVPMSAAQVTMVISLGKVFDIELTESAAKSILSAAAATLIGTTIARSILKFIPGIGWLASAGVAFTVTEALGWTIANDFAKQYRKDCEIQREKERAEETIRIEKRKFEEEIVNHMNEMDDPDEYDDINLSAEDNNITDLDIFNILISSTGAYIYKGQVHIGEIIPEFRDEKRFVSMKGSFNGLELPIIYGYIGKCFEDNKKTFIVSDISVNQTLKNWCLNNVNAIKYLFSKHNITDNEIYDLSNYNDLPRQNPPLHLKWMKLIEELLRSSNLQKINT